MSSVKIQGNASGTGILTIAAPNTNTDRTLTLPDEAGTLATTNGITVLDQWRLSTNTNTNTNGAVSTNWERPDDPAFAGIGATVSESSGVFSFPSTGIYMVILNAAFGFSGSDDAAYAQTQVTQNNGGAWDIVAVASSGSSTPSDRSAASICIVNVSDVSQVKLRLNTSSFSAVSLIGQTNSNYTSITFVKIA